MTELKERLLAMDAGVTHRWILEHRLIWFLIGAGGKATRDQLVKHFEESDMLEVLLQPLRSIGVIEEENGLITLVEGDGWRLDYF